MSGPLEERTMEIRMDVIMRNLEAFSYAYGLDASLKRLAEDLINGNGYVRSVGILLREPDTKRGLVTCEFPITGDYTRQMLWVPIDEKPVEAVPIYTREKGVYQQLRNIWRSLTDSPAEDHYRPVEEGELKLKVHHSLCKHGVIEKYLATDAYGFVRRKCNDIFFMKKWCYFERIEEGKKVSFVPIISRRGLQARAIEELKT